MNDMRLEKETIFLIEAATGSMQDMALSLATSGY
jgi:hypothetical protein